MKKFEQGDLLVNTIKAYPHNKFFVYTGSVIYNNRQGEPGADITDYNITGIYPFKVKDNSLTTFKTITTKNFNEYLYGSVITGSYPLSSSIYFEHHCANSTRTKINALKNVMNGYKYLSTNYDFGDRDTRELTFIEISSIFYGSSIKKGSVSLKFYNSGSLKAELQDNTRNGDLIEVTGSNTGSIAGSILYGEGIVILTGSWSINDLHKETYQTCPAATSVNPAWKYFGVNVSSSSYEIEFKGINYVQTLTMFCHMGAGEFNFSNNPTFITRGQTALVFTGSSGYIENDELTTKNIVKSHYDKTEESFKKTTHISKIAILDENKNIIAIAKLSSPLKKTEEREYTVKIKIDI
jgi:hypothetical protein